MEMVQFVGAAALVAAFPVATEMVILSLRKTIKGWLI